MGTRAGRGGVVSFGEAYEGVEGVGLVGLASTRDASFVEHAVGLGLDRGHDPAAVVDRPVGVELPGAVGVGPAATGPLGVDPPMRRQLVGCRGLDPPAARPQLCDGFGRGRVEQLAFGVGCGARRVGDLGCLTRRQATGTEPLRRRGQRLQPLGGRQRRGRGAEPLTGRQREEMRGAAVPAAPPHVGLIHPPRQPTLGLRARMPGTRHAPQHPHRIRAVQRTRLETRQRLLQRLTPVSDLPEHDPSKPPGCDTYVRAPRTRGRHFLARSTAPDTAHRAKNGER